MQILIIIGLYLNTRNIPYSIHLMVSLAFSIFNGVDCYFDVHIWFIYFPILQPEILQPEIWVM